MRKFSLISLLFILISSKFCDAYSGQFYTYSGQFYSRNSGLCPSGNVVQAIVQKNSFSVPPSPNSPFLGDGEKMSISHQRCEVMGTDPLAEWFYGDGNFGSLNSGPSEYKYGYMRAFSSKLIIESAYFVNTPCVSLNDDSNPPSNNDIQNIVVNIINPAYAIPFDVCPTNGVDIGEIKGSVLSSLDGDNNLLKSCLILVEWRYESSTNWILGDDLLSDNGDFYFNVYISESTNIYVRARVKNSAAPLKGFPVSSEFKIHVNSISSFTPIISITNVSPIFVDYGSVEQTIGGTSMYIEGSLSWSNSLNPGVHFVADFPIKIINLSVGNNIITVFASNKYNRITNDFISIVRQKEPIPFVNITNSSPLTVDFGSTKQTLGGVISNIAGCLTWVNNTSNYSGYAEKFPVDITNLIIGENIISIFGSNQYGTFAQDNISIIRKPEPLPFIDITNKSPVKIEYGKTKQIIDGITSNISGRICWSNSFVSGINSSETFPLIIEHLIVGTNLITVFGTNKFNRTANDKISIIREKEPIPFVKITNSSPLVVNYNVFAKQIGGTNLNIAGYLHWSNSLVKGICFAKKFPINITNIVIGNNIITVYATNKYNRTTCDKISIIKEKEPVPFIDITNHSPIELEFEITQTRIGWTNVNVVGQFMWVNNRNNLTNVASNSIITITDLYPGLNLITVFASNKFGRVAKDTVLITRFAKPVLNITKPTISNFWISNAELILVAGTIFDHSGFAGTSLIVSNETSGSWYKTAPRNNWGPELTEVSFPTNIIKVIYVNVAGEKVTDYIKVINGLPPCLILKFPENNSVFSNLNVRFSWKYENVHLCQNVYIDNLFYGNAVGITNITLPKGLHSWWVSTTDDGGKTISSSTNYFEITDTWKKLIIRQAGMGFDDGKYGGVTFNWSEPAPTNSLIQIIGSNKPNFPYPTPDNFIASNNFLLTETFIGTGKELLNYYQPCAGEFATSVLVNYPTNNYIIVRSFSSTSVINSAYLDQSTIFNPWSFYQPYPLESLVNVFVNPAYKIPPAKIKFLDTEPFGNLIDVTGDTSTGYDDNQLRYFDVTEKWINFTINSSGVFNVSYDKFSGKIPVLTNCSTVITNHLAFRTVGKISGLPVSDWQHFYIPNIVEPVAPVILAPIHIEPGCSNCFVTTNTYIKIYGSKKQKNEKVFAVGNYPSSINQSFSSKEWHQTLCLQPDKIYSIEYYSTNILGTSENHTVLIIDVVPEPVILLLAFILLISLRRQNENI